MYYKAVRENDGTYSIRSSQCGLNYNEIEQSGVRGCNVQRTLNRFISNDFYKQCENERKEKPHDLSLTS